MNCEGSKLGWLGRSSNENRRRRRQVGLVSHGGVGFALASVGIAVRPVLDWVSHSLALVSLSVSLHHGDTALCFSPSQRHGPLNLIKMGLCTLYFYLYLSVSQHSPLTFLSFFFFLFFPLFFALDY